MPFGDNDWLALTQESTLEPEIPICDPHHHLRDLRPARIPHQRFLLDEPFADLNSGHNVRSTVFIETRAMYRNRLLPGSSVRGFPDQLNATSSAGSGSK